MNLKQMRAKNRAHRRILLNAAKNEIKAEVLSQRLVNSITQAQADRLMDIVDSCRNLGDVSDTRLTVKAHARR